MHTQNSLTVFGRSRSSRGVADDTEGHARFGVLTKGMETLRLSVPEGVVPRFPSRESVKFVLDAASLVARDRRRR